MANTGHYITESFVAGADLSAKQFTFVIMNTTDRTVVSAGNAAAADGVLLNEPESGQSATVAVFGRLRVEVGAGGLTAGDLVGVDTNSEAVTADSSDTIVGKCVDSAAAGERATIDFFRGGNAAV